MLLRIFSDYDAMSRKAALMVAATVETRPDAVLGMPTGGTPKGMFQHLVELRRRYGLDLTRIRTFNLDEYVGVPGSDPRSFRGYMDLHFFGPCAIRKDQIGFLDGTVSDLAAEAKRYDEAIVAAGGIDLIVLGIGSNGHIAFNEPSEAFSKGTNVIRLAPSTVDVCVADFSTREQVPARAITMGIGTLMSCRRVMLMASGAGKAAAIREAVIGAVTPRCPATALQHHPAVELLLDRAAFAQLEPELPRTGVEVRREA